VCVFAWVCFWFGWAARHVGVGGFARLSCRALLFCLLLLFSLAWHRCYVTADWLLLPPVFFYVLAGFALRMSDDIAWHRDELFVCIWTERDARGLVLRGFTCEVQVHLTDCRGRYQLLFFVSCVNNKGKKKRGGTGVTVSADGHSPMARVRLGRGVLGASEHGQCIGFLIFNYGYSCHPSITSG
jgi:hypothetical protein